MDITTYFESDDFLDILGSLKDYCSDIKDVVELTEQFIAVGMDYWKIFSGEEISMDKMNNFMRNIASKYKDIIDNHGSFFGCDYEFKSGIYELYLDDLLDKFDLDYEDLKDFSINKKLREYIAVKLLSPEYKFHAFNGSFLDSIMRYGLDPNHKLEDQSELDMINDLFEKHGEKLILGWQKLNCDGNVSYADTAASSYYYAVNSPEWFAQFTGQGFSFNPEGKYDKRAFVRKDYEAASNNLMTLMEEKDFSQEEITCVMGFFNKYWDIYASDKAKPMLCVVTGKNERFEDVYDYVMNNDYTQQSFRNLMSVCLASHVHDGRTNQTIDTSNALFIGLPEVSRVLEKMNIDNKGNNVKK